MFKEEVICVECDSHYIIVTRGAEDSKFCPYCSNEIDHSDDLEDDEESEVDVD